MPSFENIPLDTKIIFLAALECKNARYYYFCISVAILAAILDFSKSQPSYQFISHIIEFLDFENIPLDIKIIFLAAIVSKIWLICYISGYLGSHLGSHLEFFKTSNQFISLKIEFREPGNILTHQNNLPGYSRKKNIAMFIFW